MAAGLLTSVFLALAPVCVPPHAVPASQCCAAPTVPCAKLTTEEKYRLSSFFPARAPLNHVLFITRFTLHTHKPTMTVLTYIHLYRPHAIPARDVIWFDAQRTHSCASPAGDWDRAPLARVSRSLTGAPWSLFFPSTPALLTAVNAALAHGDPLNLILCAETNSPGVHILASSQYDTWLYRPLLQVMDMVPEPALAALITVVLLTHRIQQT